MYPESLGRLAATILFIGFNLTFFPQFILGYLGHASALSRVSSGVSGSECLSTAGASILAIGYLLPALYLLWSLKYGKIVGANPWQAAGLEWTVQSPPPAYNFEETPIVDFEAYDYDRIAPGVEVSG